MKSICIKTNNSKIINYLFSSFAHSPSDFICSKRRFKNFDNVIVHSNSVPLDIYLNEVCNILLNCVLDIFEPKLIRRLINYNYFYFSEFEKKCIQNNCDEIISLDNDYLCRKTYIHECLYSYLSIHHSIVIEGFVNFRLPEYSKTLNTYVDFSVNKFIIEKEYLEFIKLLKVYISSNPSKINSVHLVYNESEPILLDSENRLISLQTNILDNTSELNGISFSNNDYILNTLLSLLPKKIYIHSLSTSDEFLNTLTQIFTNRICFCKN